VLTYVLLNITFLEDQDKYSNQYERSAKAWEAGKFDNEVVPVAVPQRKGDPIIVSKDEEFTNVKIEKSQP
jgi:acetyl-CoA C-acetyltransferase